VKIPLLPVKPLDERLVVEALVIVAVPVVLVLVNVAPTAERLVVEALRAVKLVVDAVTAANKVLVEFKNIDDVAYTFCAYTLRSLPVEDPSEYAKSCLGTKLPNLSR